jgi:peroxiredoxin
MNAVVCGLVCLVVGAEVEPRFEPGTLLHYQGSVAQSRRDDPAGGAAEKTYDLTLLVSRSDDQGLDFYWLVEERGAGAFGWADRFGSWSQNAEGAAVGLQGPALLFDYGTGKHVVPLAAPRFVFPQAAEVGAKWERDGSEYEILRSTTAVERPVWQVDVRNQFGPQKRIWVDKDTQLVLQQDDRVFMNQGTEYRSAVQLRAVEKPAEADAAAMRDGLAALVHLKGKLKRPARSLDDAWTPEQLQLLAKHLPEAKPHAGAGSLARIVAAAETDLKRQNQRAGALDEVVGKQMGRQVEKFSLSGLDGAKLTEADLAGNVTVLHFWDYRDTPLKEPYGQVGYLEFLFARHQEAGVKVYGVAVDSRFQQESTARTAIAGVRKLKSFMNLSYPILFDAGDLVRQFGDPRLAGGELPLFVVIGRDGKIAHYKIGHYRIDREHGLKELDAAVKSQLAVGKTK